MPSGNRDEPQSGTDEIELKFAVAPQELARLRRHPLLNGVPPLRRAVTSTYFDTPDLDLRRRALALRLRKVGRRHVQTLKACGRASAAHLRRAQWEAPVDGAAPDLSQAGLEDRLAGIDGAALQPIFRSRVQRSMRLVQPDPATKIEISCDRGTIETPDGASLPVCEIELELKAGSPRALFDVARALNETAPLRIETRSKAERGYGLLASEGGEARITHRHGKVDLSRDMPVEEALAAITRHCLEHMLANGEAALAGKPEGVHQMRVALRRLRATFSLFKPMIPAEQWQWATREMKRIASALGEARNWDVLAHQLAPLETAFSGDDDVAALSRAIGEKREVAYAVMRETIASGAYTDFALRMMSWVETRGWRDQAVSESSVHLLAPVGDMADGLLKRRYRRARKLAKRFAELDTAGRHKLRIALKKLRYAVDSLQRIYDPKPVKRHLKRLSGLQDDLGLLNDIATMDRLLHDLGASPGSAGDLRRGAALMQGWYGCILAERAGRLGKKLSRFLKVKPFWRVWADT